MKKTATAAPDSATEANFKMVGAALQPVQDPEIHMSVVDLGLIYGAEFGESPKGRSVKVRMSLTSPACRTGRCSWPRCTPL